MAHEWDRGVLNSSSWHGLEEIGTFRTAQDAIDHGERSGAYPVTLAYEGLYTETSRLKSRSTEIVGFYRDTGPRAIGTVGGRFQATTPEEWRSLIHAAVEAGVRPTGTFSLRGGSRVLFTGEIGESNGIKVNFVLVDAFDGSMHLTGGKTPIRVVCANTLSAAMKDSGALAKVRHTSSLSAKVQALEVAVQESIEQGKSVKEMYHVAEDFFLGKADFGQLFNALFPEAPADAGKLAVTKADNARKEAWAAMLLPVNNAGRTVASLWNAATYLVDRKATGQTRECRGGADMLDSLLFGSRAARLDSIFTTVAGFLPQSTSRELVRA